MAGSRVSGTDAPPRHGAELTARPMDGVRLAARDDAPNVLGWRMVPYVLPRSFMVAPAIPSRFDRAGTGRAEPPATLEGRVPRKHDGFQNDNSSGFRAGARHRVDRRRYTTFPYADMPAGWSRSATPRRVRTVRHRSAILSATVPKPDPRSRASCQRCLPARMVPDLSRGRHERPRAPHPRCTGAFRS